jgi:hypothetical protein
MPRRRLSGTNLARCLEAHGWAVRHHHPDLSPGVLVQVEPRSIALYKQGTDTPLYGGGKCGAWLKRNNDGMQVCETLA